MDSIWIYWYMTYWYMTHQPGQINMPAITYMYYTKVKHNID